MRQTSASSWQPDALEPPLRVLVMRVQQGTTLARARSNATAPATAPRRTGAALVHSATSAHPRPPDEAAHQVGEPRCCSPEHRLPQAAVPPGAVGDLGDDGTAAEQR